MQKKLTSYMSTIGAALLLLSVACSNDSNDGGDAADSGSSTAGSGQSGKGGSFSTEGGKGGSRAATGGSRAATGGSRAGHDGSQDGGTENDAATKASGAAVVLGTSANFAILAKSGISTVPTSAITGDIGVSPVAATYITGFSETADSSNVYATAGQVTGKIFAANYAVPTPSNMTQAISDMEIGYADASARAADVSALGAGDIGGMTLTAGVYKWSTDLLIPSDVTLSGSATDLWILQIAGNLTVGNGNSVKLAGGALAKNVFWQVAGQAVLGTTVHFEGTLLSKTSITLGAGASVNGRLLAQTAATIDSSTVVKPVQ
jgi:hypothetical protein